MAIRTVEDREHQEFRAAFLERTGGDVDGCHIGMKHIYWTETDQEKFCAYICARAPFNTRRVWEGREHGDRWHARCSTASMVVSFFGTKGGTGTTTLAVNAAADIRHLTAGSVVIVDLKTGPGDVSLFLGLRPHHSLLTAIDRVSWRDPGEMARLMTHHACGLHALASGDEFGRPGARDEDGVEQTLRCLAGLYDFVVIDAGSTLMPATAAALQLSDAVLLVANPDVPCLRNLQRLIDAVRLSGVSSERLRVALNRASEFGVLSTAQIERVLGLTIAYSVNSDYRTVASAVNAGVPVSSLRESRLQRQLAAIAQSLADHASHHERVRPERTQPSLSS
ncbi:MAG: AAA family ATPase [Vicinamibacterales bacterium]